MNSWAVSQVKNNWLLHLLALSLSILACYYGLWNAYFLTDDYWMLGWVRFHDSLGDAIWAQFGYGVRFLLDASLWIRVKLFDLNASPYYWVSMVQHILVAFIVYGLGLFWTRRRTVAFLTALLFGTTFTHFTVVTWITGSEYSQAAILYLATLAFFALYLRQLKIGWYLGSLVTFVMLLLFLEMSLSVPLVLLAYHFTLGFVDRKLGSIHWRDIRLHAPYWILLIMYLILQFRFVQSGSSEATVAEHVYMPGIHVVRNLYYLVYLVVPPYGSDILALFLGPSASQVFTWLTVTLAIIGNLLAAYCLWNGSALVRFAVAFVYLPFLPYTLWQGEFAGAIRYRYLPAIGFFLLVALFLLRVHDRLRNRQSPRVLQYAVPLVVAALLIINLVIVQAWVQRHVENSAFRQAFVTQLVADYADVEPRTEIYIEIPADKFDDLEDACSLVFEQPVECIAFLPDQMSMEDTVRQSRGNAVYWLRATTEGIYQVFPANDAKD